MKEHARWVRYQMECPEQRGASQLLLEWRVRGGGETLNSVSCDNPQLKDLSGSECQWSCWEQLTRAKI